MDNLRIEERLKVTRVSWSNCQKIECEYLPECTSTKPIDKVICKKFPIKPYNIYIDNFIKKDDKWLKYDG